MKRRTKTIIILTLLTLSAGVAAGGGALGERAKALKYSSEMDVQFTFNPTVSIDVTGDLTIAELAPGNALDSNIITVTAGSNEANGYTLYSTVGSSTNNYTDLRLSSSNTANVFTNLSANKTKLADFDNNTWGYSYCLTTNDCDTDNTYWVSGNAGSTVAGYNGLPIYDASDNTTGVVLAKTDSAAETELKFKIGAKAAANQASGTYTNTVNFIGVAKVITTNYALNYNANAGSDTVTNMPASISDGTTNTSAITLSNTTPMREGYVFKGWCTTNTSETACSDGTLYGPGRIYVFANPGATTTVNLYATWQKNNPCDGHWTELYCKVMAQSKGTQTAADLKAVITKPTSVNSYEDTSNSGVYEYDSSVFGESSDVDGGYSIYYYRGILDSNLDASSSSSYGSNGDGAYYPNYVRLGDTCWRIVRTTASGGTKMVYNGSYSGGTTANSCANATSNAQVTTQAFGLQGNSAQSSNWYRNINRIGYTFNNDSSIQDATTATSVDTVFGSNSNYTTTNTTNSNIKNYIENTWFSNISAYENILEPSAGYCNDRTAFTDDSGATALSSIAPYATSNAEMYFGAGVRHNSTGSAAIPTLACARGTVDLYSTDANGNGQLAKPVALLTADEVALAGSNYSDTYGAVSEYSSNYSYSSYLRSGSDFWLFSPYYRNSFGYARAFYLSSNGLLSNGGVDSGSGVRPAISISSGTVVHSGEGTAANPWIINAL